jgi:ubiquinone/menaquinone biosynthesis C-methylase UbiE
MTCRSFHACALHVALVATFLGCAAATPTPSSHPAPASLHPSSSGHGAHDATAHHSFEDVDHWVSVFDDPARDAWQKPADVVAALQLRGGMRVADLGAGTGYFSRYLSAAVGDTGAVFAVDIEPNLLVHVRQRAEQEHTPNVVPVLGSADNPRLPAGSVDVVLIVDTVHHIDDRITYLQHLRQALKAGGRVAVIDFKKEALPVGPPPEHKLARGQIVEEFTAAGYRLVAQPDVLPYQYFLIFEPS